MKAKKTSAMSKSSVLKAKPVKKAKKRVAAPKKPGARSAALKPRPPLVTSRRMTRRPGVRSTSARKQSSISSMQMFWSAGILGGVLVVFSALWSALQAPAPVSQVPVWRSSPTAQADPAAMTIALPVAQAPSVAPPAPASVAPGLQAAFDQTTKLPNVAERMGWWAQWVMRDERFAHEQLAFLGAGPKIADEAPLLPEKFDCTTFLETVMALSRSRQPADFYQKLIEIRYQDAKPTYLRRNHFPEADWIPNNISAGILSDATESVARRGAIEPMVAQKTIDRAKWIALQQRKSASVARALASASESLESFSPQSVSLTYLPREALLNSLDAIPQGSVISFVRANDKHRPVLISHQGIVVIEGSQVLLRHASPGGKLRVIGLGDYLRKNTGFIGVTLSRVNN